MQVLVALQQGHGRLQPVGVLSTTAQTNTPATVSYSPAANFNGTATIILTPDVVAGCPAPVSATRTITVNTSAKLVPGGQDNICQSATPAPYLLVGATLSGATSATWSITSGGGTLTPAGPTGTPATVSYTPVANFTGIALLALTSSDPDGAGPCPIVSVTRVVNINAAPVINTLTATPVTLCTFPSSSTLTVTALTGEARPILYSPKISIQLKHLL